MHSVSPPRIPGGLFIRQGSREMTAWNKRVFCPQCQRRTARTHVGYTSLAEGVDASCLRVEAEVWMCVQCGRSFLFPLEWFDARFSPPDHPGVDGDGHHFEDVP